MLLKKDVVKTFEKLREKHLNWGLFFNNVANLQPATLLEKCTLSHVFFCDFCDIFKNTFFSRVALGLYIFYAIYLYFHIVNEK